jgi:hypothetical protein
MSKSPKTFLTLAGGLLASVLAASIGVFPAIADEPVVLPTGANAQGQQKVLSYACPAIDGKSGFVEVLAPAPIKEDGLSSFEPLQPGRFKWTLKEAVAGSSSSQEEWYASTQSLTLSGNWESGEVLSLELEGTISSGPAIYSPSKIDLTTTVVDPTFSRGAGTIGDPYIVSSQSDLQKIRCHENKHFALDTEISLVGSWFPIGSTDKRWEGTLDGRGFTISNLFVDYLGMYSAGLFGAVDHAYFKNLSLVNPKVSGGYRVGALIGSGRYGVGIENVSVIDGDVFGHRDVGLLMGHKDYGGLVSSTSVQGVVNASPAVFAYYWSGPGLFDEGANNIGGMIGFDDGDGTTHLRNSVDVDINVIPETNFIELADDLGLLGTVGGYDDIGGYIGETDEDSTFRFLNVNSSIKVEILGGYLDDVGGVVGENEDSWSELDVVSDIHVVALAAANIRKVGGVLGYSDDQTVSFSNAESKILIESGTATNNSLGVVHNGAGVTVSRVGGVAGEYDDNTSDSYVRSDSDIIVRNVEDITEIAGYVGYFDDDDGVGYTDNFVSGSISLDASNSISKVGGYANLGSSGKLTGTKLFAAVEMTFTGTAAVSPGTVNPFAGEVNRPAEQLAFESFWDSNLNGSSNPENYPGKPGTTAQLQSQSFLSDIGMDFEQVWKISSGSYPELREGVYSWGFLGSSTAGGSVSSPTVVRPAGPSSISLPTSAKQGAKVVVSGNRLNRITDVFVAGKKVAYMVRPNGNLTFRAPKLAPKRYQVRLVSETGGTKYKKRIRILPR